MLHKSLKQICSAFITSLPVEPTFSHLPPMGSAEGNRFQAGDQRPVSNYAMTLSPQCPLKEVALLQGS